MEHNEGCNCAGCNPLYKQSECPTCDGAGFKWFTDSEISKWMAQGGDYFNISNKCPDCDNDSFDSGGVFPRV